MTHGITGDLTNTQIVTDGISSNPVVTQAISHGITGDSPNLSQTVVLGAPSSSAGMQTDNIGACRNSTVEQSIAQTFSVSQACASPQRLVPAPGLRMTTSICQSTGSLSSKSSISKSNNSAPAKNVANSTNVAIKQEAFKKTANALMVKKLIADKIKTKLEQPKDNNHCISCGGKWYKSHNKWKWKTCGLCGLMAHTECLGWSKEDGKKRLFICSKCNTGDSDKDK